MRREAGLDAVHPPYESGRFGKGKDDAEDARVAYTEAVQAQRSYRL